MSKRSADLGKEDPDTHQSDPATTRTGLQWLFSGKLLRDTGSLEYRSFSGQSVVIASGSGEIVEVRQAPEHSDIDSQSLIGRSADEIWPGRPSGRLAERVQRAIRGRQVESAEFSSGADDRYLDFVFIPQGRDRVMIVARDISDRKTEFDRMERLAYLDDTTKLPNRLFLVEELQRCTDLLRLQEGRAAVICLDATGADGHLNALGIADQDAVLVELASRMMHELRGANDDSVDDYERYTVAARIEQYQFGVILPVIESGSDAESVARRLIETLQQPVRLRKHDKKISIRAGIALFPQDGSDADTLVTNALAAMEDAKSNPGTPYKLHSGTVRLRALQRQDLELELRAALDNDEFAVDFLPIVAADTGDVMSVEALLRWPQNMFHQQSIKKVIAIAENTGLILPIGDWVLRKSLQALGAWHEAGFPDIRLSVNLSVQEFSRDDLVQRIEKALNESSVEARHVDLEISEYTLFRDAMKNYAMCEALKALGVGIVVDDYGTGACSLAHVARSPVDTIKIDNSFVANAVHDDRERAACGAIIAMAKSLGKKIIAEGVETREHAELLIEQGCDAMQGYLICKPASADEIAEFLAGNAAT